MGITLTDDPSVFQDIIAPDGTTARDYLSVLVPLQRLANRSRQNKNRLDAIAPSTDGVRVLRTVATLNALRAIGAVDHPDGCYAVVEDWGLYRYDIDSTQTALDPVVVQPTDVVGGGTPGRWHIVALGKSALNAVYGIPQCDDQGRVPSARVRNGIIYAKSTTGGLVGTGGDIGTTAQSFTGLVPGDVIQFTYSVHITPQAGHQGIAQVNSTDPSTGVGLVASTLVTKAFPAGTSEFDGVPVGGAGFFNVTSAGTHALVIHVSTDGTSTSFANAVLNSIVIRP